MADEPKKPSIMIATPMYGGMCSGRYVQGLLENVTTLQSMGVPVFWAHTTNESLITRARNELVRVFLSTTNDYLMFIDADIGFGREAIATLLASDCDVACGIYPKKEVDWGQVKRFAIKGEEELQECGGSFVFNMIGSDSQDTNESGMIEVRHGGTGFMLIKRSVFDFLAPHVPTYRINSYQDPTTGEYVSPLVYEFFATSIDDTGTLLSEDYHFCELFRKHGGKIHATPFLRLDHVGTYTYTGNILKTGGNFK